MRALWSFIVVVVALLIGASPGFAQTGFRLTPGAGLCVASNIISECLPLKNQSTANYTFLATDNANQMELGGFTYTLAQAGTGGFVAGWRLQVVNISTTAAATITTTTSVFHAGGENTSMMLPPGGFGVLQSDGVNWIFIGFNEGGVITDVSENRTVGVYECGQTVLFSSNGTNGVAISLSNTAPAGCNVDFIQTGTDILGFAPVTGGSMQSFDSFGHAAGRWAAMTGRVMTNTTGANAAWLLTGRG